MPNTGQAECSLHPISGATPSEFAYVSMDLQHATSTEPMPHNQSYTSSCFSHEAFDALTSHFSSIDLTLDPAKPAFRCCLSVLGHRCDARCF